jgi:hypothetical protein
MGNDFKKCLSKDKNQLIPYNRIAKNRADVHADAI